MSANASTVPASALALIAAQESRLVRTTLLVYGVIGLCLGALIGGLAFAAMPTDTTATAFLRLRNPADLAAIAAGASQMTPDNQSNTGNFVAGEIAYLSGDGFAQAVGNKLALDEPPELNIAQANESTVVTISASSSDRDDAIREVQTAIDLYREQLAQRVDAQIRRILPTLTEWQQRDVTDPTRMQELQRVRESVELQGAQSSDLLVMQPPTPNHPTSQQWLMGALLGALVGGAGAVAVPLLRRRRTGRAAMVQTLTDSVDAVAVPPVDLSSSDAASDPALARTLAAQLGPAAGDRMILVAGASADSGTEAVTSLLASAVDGDVVDGGAVGYPTLTADLVASATDIVAVARLDHDTAADVVALRSAVTSDAARVIAVLTYRRRRFRGER